MTGGSFLDLFVLQGSLKDSPLFEGSVKGLLRGFGGFFQGSSSFSQHSGAASSLLRAASFCEARILVLSFADNEYVS